MKNETTRDNISPVVGGKLDHVSRTLKKIPRSNTRDLESIPRVKRHFQDHVNEGALITYFNSGVITKMPQHLDDFTRRCPNI